jgi:hypothetical protein
MAKRKHRKDRNHIIYKLTNECTGDTYIGVTVVQNRKAQKSLRGRWLRHIHKAVRAFEFEANLINEVRPTLNTKMVHC